MVMRNKTLLFFVIPIFIVAIITRVPLVEKMHSHTDSSSLALAITDYNLAQETPAPPGYPMYITFGKLIYYFTHDAHTALIIVSILSTGLGAVAYYYIGRLIRGNVAGVIAAALFLSSPSIYFFGLTIYPYLLMIAIEMFFIALCYKVVVKKENAGLLLGCVFALLLGVRPQEAIVTVALAIYTLFKINNKNRGEFAVAFTSITLAWLIPFLGVVGGYQNYIKLSAESANGALPLPSLNPILNKQFELLSGAFLTLGLGIFFGAKYLVDLVRRKENLAFYFLWFIPPLLFNLFVRTEHAGYQAGYLSFGLVAAALTLENIYKKRNIFGIFLMCVVVLTNLFIFFYDRDPNYQKPYRQSSFHYSDIVRNDYVLKAKVDFISTNFDPKDTVVIAGPYFWRHARYYLPNYHIYYVDSLFQRIGDKDAVVIEAYKKQFKNYFLGKKGLNIEGVERLILFDDLSENFDLPNKQVVKFKGITGLTVVNIKGSDWLKFFPEKIEIYD